MNADSSVQIVYFSHGGGPLPILGDPSHKAMIDFMTELPSMLKKPDIILVISAHWEEEEVTVLGADSPEMFYDYYGFPEEAYKITYPAPGNPEYANRIVSLLGKNNIPARLNLKRGFDHGLFIPLKMMYPEADIPCLQISLMSNLDPREHIVVGNTLKDLEIRNALVIGSGFSFHNMRAFSWQGDEKPDPSNDEFQNWLIETCTASFTHTDRLKRLAEWKYAPFARYCHPREEHLLPLHICAGWADKPAELIFDDYILGKRAVSFLWS